jgi:ferredoxin-type protein NapF
MGTTIDRMQFLKGDFSGSGLPVRPPWSLPEQEFVDRCERCDDCVKCCPEAVLVRGRGGYPVVDFAKGGCTFCGDCLNACKGRALVGDAEDEASAWTLRAGINGACLAVKGVVCRSCGEVCDESAIRFKLEVGGIARPLLDQEQCNGCGACFAVCPVRAVRIAPAEWLGTRRRLEYQNCAG